MRFGDLIVSDAVWQKKTEDVGGDGHMRYYRLVLNVKRKHGKLIPNLVNLT